MYCWATMPDGLLEAVMPDAAEDSPRLQDL